MTHPKRYILYEIKHSQIFSLNIGSLRLQLDINTEERYSVVVAHSDTPVLGTLNTARVPLAKVFIIIVIFF